LRQEADHRIGEGVRLLDVGNVRGVEDRHAGALYAAADEFAGRHDMSTTIADAEFMRSRIPGASMTILDAAHISNVEQPHAFTDGLIGFLTQR
jgi:pimeloyl-ACP methyl ester carboxylesterase